MNLDALTRKAFPVGIVALTSTFLLAFVMLGLEHSGSPANVTNSIAITAALLFFVFLVCALILWIEAFVRVVMGWKGRHIVTGVALIVFLLVGHFVAAFLLHALWINRHKRTESKS